MGLPLGVDYERKKQRLQQELCMDYKRYMSQDRHAPLLKAQQDGPPSRRDAATLTGHRREVRRPLRLSRANAPGPGQDQEVARQPRRLVDQGFDDDDDDDDDDDGDERQDEYTGLKAGLENRALHPDRSRELMAPTNGRFQPSEEAVDLTAGRRKRENPVRSTRARRRSRALTNTDEGQFATGLLIGRPDEEEVQQRKKELYRQELQEQIAEQRRNKKREKDLELTVAATGANDPEKQPGRIRQFGLDRSRFAQVVEPSPVPVPAEQESYGGWSKLGVREDQTHLALYSPLLEYSTALGLRDGGSPNTQPGPGPHFRRATNTPRMPVFPPHPPSSTLPETHKSPDSDPYHSYHRDILDTRLPYYGQLPSSDGLPASYWTLPPGGALSNQSDHHSSQCLHSGSNPTEPPTLSPVRTSVQVTAVGSGLGRFPADGARNTRERMLIYKEALDQQIQERRELRCLELEEKRREEAQLDVAMKNHQPWGRGGGGAPLLDSTGNLLTDLKQMHRLNEEACTNPEQRRRAPVMAVHTAQQPGAGDGFSGSTHTQHPHFARDSAIAVVHPTAQQLQDKQESSCVGPTTTRERQLSYKEALDQQIQERRKLRCLELEEKRREEAQLEVAMKNHQPWGRGGGGAPLLDSTGNLLTDLKQMHRLNEEACTNPEQRRRAPVMAVHTAQQPGAGDGFSGSTHTQHPQFARDSAFAVVHPTAQQLQDKHKAYLKEQIEEKRRKQVEERERIRLEEEKEERRLAEQRACIQREYEEEQERKKRKELDQQAKNEEMIRLAMERRREAERRKGEVAEKENESLRRHYERDKLERLEEVHRRPSPPIPALQRRETHHRCTPRPPTTASQRSTAPLSETSLSGLQSPPVPACRNQLRAEEDQRDVIRELSVLRRQLYSEQKRIEGHLMHADSSMSDRQRKRSLVDIFDMARLRLQAPVRPMSRHAEPSNLLRIHHSLQLGHDDGDSRSSSTEAPREGEEVGVASRRRRGYRGQHPPLDSQWMTVQDDYLDLPPLQQNYLKRANGMSSRGSLLPSESAFIDPLGNTLPVPATPEQQKTPQLSARERRRLSKQTHILQGKILTMNAARPAMIIIAGLAGSGGPLTFQMDQATFRAPHRELDARTERRQNHSGMGLASGRRRHHRSTADLSDGGDDEGDPWYPQAFPQGRSHHSSMETVAIEPWLRPGTSDTLKRLMRGLSTRDATPPRE